MMEDLGKYEGEFSAAIADFDGKVKAAAQIVDPYMSKKASPMPVDTVKKLEDFKKSVLEFNNACKVFSKRAKEITTTMTDQKTLLAQKVEDAKLAAGEDPEVLKQQLAATSEKLASATVDLSSANDRVQELTTERDAIQAAAEKQREDEVAQWREKLRAAELNFTEQRAALDAELGETRLALQIESAALAELREKLRAAEAAAAQASVQRDEAVAEAAECRKKADFVSTKLEVTEKTRASEFRAYEQATQAHEKDLGEWERRCSDLRRQLEAAKGEREGMRSRLADEHLREHIRALQVENNQLREERVANLHSRASQNAAMAVESPLRTQLTAAEKEARFLQGEITALRDRLFEREKESFELAQRLEVETARGRATSDELAQKLFMAQMTIEQLSRGEDAGVAKSGGENSTSRRRASSDEMSQRSVGSQCEDRGRLELEREVLMLRGRLRDAEEDLASAQQRADEQRAYLEEKLLHAVRDYETQVGELRTQLKVVAYKNSRLAAELQNAESTLQSPAMDLLAAENEARLDEWRRGVEKRAVAAEMDAQSLQLRVASLRRENEQLREHYEAQLQRLTDDFNASIGRTQTPRGGSVAAGSRGVSIAPASSMSHQQQQQQQYPVDPLEVPLRSPSFIDKLHHIDEALLRIHSECVALDEKERRVGEQKEASLKKIADRMRYLQAAELFWSRDGRAQSGPNGESADEMLALTAREVEDLARQRAQVDSGAVLFYKELGEARARLQESSNALIKQRSELYKGA